MTRPTDLPPPPPPPRRGHPPGGGPTPPGTVPAGQGVGRPGAGVTVQAVLLSLGTFLLAVAAVVFTAMNWSRLGATAQGAVLVVLTGLVAAATSSAVRRGLTATAEALGAVTVVLALVDAHAARVSIWPDAGLAAFWAGALAVVAALAWWLAAANRVRSTEAVAVVMAQVPSGLFLIATDASPAVAGTALLLQVGVVAVVISDRFGAGRRLHPLTATCAAVPAVGTWASVTGWSTLRLLLDGSPGNPGIVLVVATATAVAITVAVCWAHVDPVRDLALVVGSLTGLAAAGWGSRMGLERDMALAAFAAAAATVAAACVRIPARWGAVPAATSTLAAGWVSLALLDPLERVTRRLSELSVAPWAGDAADRAVTAVSRGDLYPVVVAVHLVAAAALVGAWWPRLDRGLRSIAVAGLVVVPAALAPAVLPLSVGGAAALLWVTAALVVAAYEAAVVAPRSSEATPAPRLRAACATLVPLVALGGWWSVSSSALSLLAAGVTAALGVWAVARGCRLRDVPVARTASAVVVVAMALESASIAALDHAGAETSIAVAGAAGLATAALGALLLPSRVSIGGEVAGWCLHATAALAVVAGADSGGHGGPGIGTIEGAWRVTLLSGAVAAALRSVRTRDPIFVALATGEALVLWWVELAVIGVRAPEPYTLPLAGAMGVAGGIAARRSTGGPSPSSWVTDGPALMVAAVPSGWVSLADPTGPRPLLTLAAGGALLAVGAFAGRRAPVDVGTGLVAVLGLSRLLPVVADAPNWATIGATGAVLLAVGATFEERRRDVRGFRDRYRALQ